MKNTQEILTKEERLQCLKDMQSMRFTQKRADLIAEMELQESDQVTQWSEVHTRCLSCIDKAQSISINIKNTSNRINALACVEVMRDLLQESPENMEGRIKALMQTVWENVNH